MQADTPAETASRPLSYSRAKSFHVKRPNRVVPAATGVPSAQDLGKKTFEAAPWCGTFETGDEEQNVPFMTVSVPRDGHEADMTNSYNPHLVRFYMQHVWKLKRPDVIISVSGGAKQFDLSTENKDKVMKGMMEGTRALDAWFITGGSNAGIMKFVGE